MSFSDAQELTAAQSGPLMMQPSALRSDALLDVVPIQESEAPLADSIDHELKKLSDSASTVSCASCTCNATSDGRQKYHVREREMIYVASDTESVSHTNSAGDINGSKAWRAVKRPSDMVRNEDITEARELTQV